MYHLLPGESTGLQLWPPADADGLGGGDHVVRTFKTSGWTPRDS